MEEKSEQIMYIILEELNRTKRDLMLEQWTKARLEKEIESLKAELKKYKGEMETPTEEVKE